MVQHPMQQALPIQQHTFSMNQQLLSPHQANQQLLSPQHQLNHYHAMYPATEMTDSTKNYNASQSVPQQNTMQTGDYINYAVNEQYSMNSSPYDSWASFLKFQKWKS
jgi:hypothetical protein